MLQVSFSIEWGAYCGRRARVFTALGKIGPVEVHPAELGERDRVRYRRGSQRPSSTHEQCAQSGRRAIPRCCGWRLDNANRTAQIPKSEHQAVGGHGKASHARRSGRGGANSQANVPRFSPRGSTGNPRDRRHKDLGWLINAAKSTDRISRLTARDERANSSLGSQAVCAANTRGHQEYRESNILVGGDIKSVEGAHHAPR